MDRYIDGFMKWMPESLFICFILTFLVLTMSVLMTDSPFIGTEKTGGIIYGWVNGFWGLLSFAMQMTILLATGNAVASSPPAHKMFKSPAKLPQTRTQIFIFSIVVGSIFGFLHWGLGMMAACAKTTIVQAREIVPVGTIQPECVHTPHIFVDYIVKEGV
ncbi:TPA: hypothetical protein VPJ47_06935 [Streptococcus pyogenes]|nr:TIGR00366 family protein [Streptococcus pyogenes]QAX77039.1 hypothetical protein D8S76_00820 [Streptococcus pyogenes]QCK36328.1 hypothetical protein ETT67_00820 [Streptococcus pyogenes]HES9439309.1 hypothetical protein [Streptococcus pyogenes]HES9446460.1 hypothetical protein [Streptococcus pyogenes]